MWSGLAWASWVSSTALLEGRDCTKGIDFRLAPKTSVSALELTTPYGKADSLLLAFALVRLGRRAFFAGRSGGVVVAGLGGHLLRP